jgi:hypothetical protein
MLISCLERALDNDIIGVNVVKKTIAPKLDQQKKNYMTNEDMLRLISVADSGEYYEDLEKVKQDILKIQNKTHKTTKDFNKEKRDQLLFIPQGIGRYWYEKNQSTLDDGIGNVNDHSCLLCGIHVPGDA